MRALHLVPAAAVLVALGAIGGAAQWSRAAAPGPSPVTSGRPIAVTTATLACPPALGTGSGRVAFIGAAAAVTAAGRAGQAELTPLPPAGVQLRTVAPISQASPGVLALVSVPAASTAGKKPAAVQVGWSVAATGAMAPAMEAEVAQSSGLASVRCSAPGSDLWFAGPGQQDGAGQIQLDLMNVDALPATVNVSVITDAGQVLAGDDTGIIVPPHQMVTEPLSSVAAGSSVVAIHVRTTVGRVAADVLEGPAHGALSSWLTSAASPSTRQVIPGVPPSSGAAELFLAVPGNGDARVSVLAITPQGQYRPFGSQTIPLPGQSATDVALTPLGGTTAAIQLTSNVPVVAAILVPGSGLGDFTTSAAPISQQAVVAGNVAGSGLTATVVLSAPAGAARVRLTAIASGAGAAGAAAAQSQVVSVRAAHTLVVPVSPPHGAKRGSAYAVVITPLAGSGPVYAARVEQSQSSVVSIVPAASALTTISLPPVRESYDAVSP
ncbi:MAG: DUF5719 family protein [Streptosporangiaceae bacterium]